MTRQLVFCYLVKPLGGVVSRFCELVSWFCGMVSRFWPVVKPFRRVVKYVRGNRDGV